MQHQLDPHRAQFVRSATAALMPLRHQSRVVTAITQRCRQRHVLFVQSEIVAHQEVELLFHALWASMQLLGAQLVAVVELAINVLVQTKSTFAQQDIIPLEVRQLVQNVLRAHIVRIQHLCLWLALRERSLLMVPPPVRPVPLEVMLHLSVKPIVACVTLGIAVLTLQSTQ